MMVCMHERKRGAPRVKATTKERKIRGREERGGGGGYLALASADVNVQGVCLVHLHGAVLMIFPI